MKVNIHLAIFVCFFLISCSNNDPVPPNHHPNLDLLLDDDADYVDVEKEELSKWDDHVAIELKDHLGIDITDDKYEINSVADVLIKDKEILIVDDGASVVHSIDYSGNPNEPVSVTGRGPGEVVSPVSIDRGDAGFVIMDIVNGVMHFDNKNQIVQTEQLALMADSFCALDNYFLKSSSYVSDQGAENNLIFEVGQDKSIVGKYSQRYSHQSKKLIYFMASGPINCIKSRNILLNTYTLNLPVLELYDIKNGGSTLYKVDINPYRYKFEEGSLVPSEINLGTTYHSHESTSVIRERYVALQYSEVDRPEDPDEEYDTQVLSYILDLQNDEMYYTYNLPIIRAVTEDKMFTESHTDKYHYGLYTYKLTD